MRAPYFADYEVGAAVVCQRGGGGADAASASVSAAAVYGGDVAQSDAVVVFASDVPNDKNTLSVLSFSLAHSTELSVASRASFTPTGSRRCSAMTSWSARSSDQPPLVLAGFADGSLAVYDVFVGAGDVRAGEAAGERPTELSCWQVPGAGACSALAVSPLTGESVVAVFEDGGVACAPVERLSAAAPCVTNSPLYAATFVRQSVHTFMVGGAGKQISLWDARVASKAVEHYTLVDVPAGSAVQCMQAFSNDPNVVVLGVSQPNALDPQTARAIGRRSPVGRVTALDLRKRDTVFSYETHRGGVGAMHHAPGAANSMFTGGLDGELWFWPSCYSPADVRLVTSLYSPVTSIASVLLVPEDGSGRTERYVVAAAGAAISFHAVDQLASARTADDEMVLA